MGELLCDGYPEPTVCGMFNPEPRGNQCVKDVDKYRKEQEVVLDTEWTAATKSARDAKKECTKEDVQCINNAKEKCTINNPNQYPEHLRKCLKDMDEGRNNKHYVDMVALTSFTKTCMKKDGGPKCLYRALDACDDLKSHQKEQSWLTKQASWLSNRVGSGEWEDGNYKERYDQYCPAVKKVNDEFQEQHGTLNNITTTQISSDNYEIDDRTRDGVYTRARDQVRECHEKLQLTGSDGLACVERATILCDEIPHADRAFVQKCKREVMIQHLFTRKKNTAEFDSA